MKVPVKPWEKTLRLNLCRMPLVHEETTVKISKMVTYIMISILKFSVICHKHCVDHTQASQTVGIHHEEIFMLWGSFMRNPHFFAEPVCLPHKYWCVLRYSGHPRKELTNTCFLCSSLLVILFPLPKFTRFYHHWVRYVGSCLIYRSNCRRKHNSK